MKLIKPPKLNKGDFVGIISPASTPEDPSRIENGIRYLESLGYKVIKGKHLDKVFGYLAGTDEERLDDFHSMFMDKKIRAIFCLRGGYGASRLLDKLDYPLIRKNPKILVGYSDITSLQSGILQKTGLVTFAGPMLAVDFAEEVSSYVEESFWRIITSTKKIGKIKTPEHERLSNVTRGKASGSLMGGNLSIVNSLIGTDYLPNLKDNILFLEEVSEMPYRIDRMLNQLRLAGIFSKVKGIILGAFVDCNEHDPQKRTLTLGEVIEGYFGKLKIPVIYNFPNGHIRDLFTLPYGLNTKINANDCTVEITEGAVS